MKKHPSLSVASNSSIASSPMNYIGGKAKLLAQILPLFPTDIDTFYDIFAGGFNVTANVEAKRTIANDLNRYVVEVAKQFHDRDIDDVLAEIYGYINEYGLSKTDREAFLAFRASYNKNPNPIKLYTLICYSFNYQFRFNNNHEYNNPFGKDRSQFSKRLEEKLIRFSLKMKEKTISFHTEPFEDLLTKSEFSPKDFVYLDPPYLITTGSYNDGNRGFKNWTEKQEALLLSQMDALHRKGVRFALSNVIEHKGRDNEQLKAWALNYNTHHLNYDYSNSSHNTKKAGSLEVLITNY